ncbi:MAG: hypothetical protein DRN06_06465 [Thermoprotei archaeon]|nr:MAG: hypothetical protein DRN06_06465 [Thermoprotei archaeon]
MKHRKYLAIVLIVLGLLLVLPSFSSGGSDLAIIVDVTVTDEDGNTVFSYENLGSGSVIPLTTVLSKKLAGGRTYKLEGKFTVKVSVSTDDPTDRSYSVDITYTGDWDNVEHTKTLSVKDGETEDFAVWGSKSFYVSSGGSGTVSLKLSVTAKFHFPTGVQTKSRTETVKLEWEGESYSYTGMLSVSSWGTVSGFSGLSIIPLPGVDQSVSTMLGVMMFLAGVVLLVRKRI